MRGLADDGALIYFEDQRSSPSSDMLGQVVVVETDTDEVLVKRLLRGSAPGLYDLESVAGPTRRASAMKRRNMARLSRPASSMRMVTLVSSPSKNRGGAKK